MVERIFVTGAPSVGKSTLVIYYITNHYIADCPPTEVDEEYRKYGFPKNNSSPVILEIYDRASTTPWTPQDFKDEPYIFLVYSVTDRSSLLAVSDIREAILGVKDPDDNVHFVLVANKCDVVGPVITSEEGKDWAKKFGGIPFFENAKETRMGVDPLFQHAIDFKYEESSKRRKVQKRETLMHKVKRRPEAFLAVLVAHLICLISIVMIIIGGIYLETILGLGASLLAIGFAILIMVSLAFCCIYFVWIYESISFTPMNRKPEYQPSCWPWDYDGCV
eukprot:TRINITY_DN9301_c0_g1_i1.p1 TRINITY_DN9301_c0_g1~~TRINITY_DN9301_c0_g1_i1.p1  ORF type:complete len:277 (+),score=17.24 TRINITY_DN9301_c0_g1_i1:753-1583(+)